MSRQWKRAVKVTATGGGKTFDLSTMRCRFEIRDSTNQSLRTLVLRITNLSDATAQALPGKEGGKVEIQAGYEDNLGIIFTGDLKQKRIGRENPTDTYVDLYASTGDRAYGNAVVSKTLKAGSTGADIYNACLDAMKPYGITQGQIPDFLAQRKFPRPYTLFGMARSHLRTLAQSNGCTWNFRDDKLDIIPVGGTLKGDTTILNSRTGLVGMPEQTNLGIVARCLINPKIGINSMVQIDQKSIQQAAYDLSIGGEPNNSEPFLASIAADGFYRVIAIDHIGDTSGRSWYQELSCIAHDKGTTKAQAALGRGNPNQTNIPLDQPFIGPN